MTTLACLQRWRITPSWSYSLTERDSLTLNYSYFSADYRLEKTNRADNQNQQVNLSYRRSLNNRLGLGVTAAHRDFESEKLAPIAEIDLPLTNKSKSLGLTLDVNYQWSENTSFTGSFGRTNTDNERAILFVDPNNPNAPPGVSTTESDIKNTVYNVTFNRDTPRNTYFVLLSRGIVPSSTGAENTQNSFQFSFSRRLSEKLVGRINANGFDQQAINRNTNLSNEYRFLSASGSLSWRFVRDWVFSGVYTYRQNSNSFGDASSRGQSNQISATLTYRWD